jgi:hypothetical protein
MGQEPDKANGHPADRTAIRRRIKQLYEHFNRDQWHQCFEMIDPKLRQGGRVDPASHAESLEEFKKCHGAVRIWYTRISLHMDGHENKRDDRPFSYVYIVWRDVRSVFHMFRERWVKDGGRWYTRVVGLVPNREPAALAGEVPR